MTSDENEERRGFKVQDRRRFSETGEARDPHEAEAEPAAAAPGAEPSGAAVANAAYEAISESPAPGAEGEINFSTFVLSLSTQALAHLGEIPNPVDNTVAADLAAARHLIDILGLLRDKTKGNLDRAEQGLLDNILYDLRMRYVESSRHR
ncbi:MAG TPA: DUF1844 domain-containing protein [Candidatus Binatia bacterium]|nr:DUF1844 domain-containing protein [Candidatus Binatia bacterium]